MPTLQQRLSRQLRRLSRYRIVNLDTAHDLPGRLRLRRILRHFEVDCVFDVGANVGQYARSLRRDIGFRGLIISFEPEPDLAKVLARVAAGDSRWVIENKALSTRTGTDTLHVMRDSQFNSLSVPTRTETDRYADMSVIRETVVVETESLGDAFTRLRASHGFARPFLKLDTQGWDTRILDGQAEVLKHFVGLQSELSFKRIYEHSERFDAAIALYSELGFELSALTPNNPGQFPLLVECDGIFLRREIAVAA